MYWILDQNVGQENARLTNFAQGIHHLTKNLVKDFLFDQKKRSKFLLWCVATTAGLTVTSKFAQKNQVDLEEGDEEHLK